MNKTNKTIITICDEVIQKYRNDKNVLGIMLFGSAARNKFDKFSDVDFYIILGKNGKYSRNNFLSHKYRVDIILNTLAEAEKYLKKDYRNIRRITSHMLAHGKIIFARTKDLARLQKIARVNLNSITKKNEATTLMHKYSIDDFWGETQRDIENKNFTAFGIDSYLLISNIIELLLEHKGGYLKQPNEMSKVLSKADKKIASDIEKFYRSSNIKERKNTLEKLVKAVYKKTGGPMPRNWEIK